MTTYIKQPGRVEWVEYYHRFDWSEHPGSGFMFQVEESGKLLHPSVTSEATIAECLTGMVSGKPIIDMGIQRSERNYYDSGSVRCDCGREHHLERGDSRCECGQDYNASGQRLNPPHMWDDIDHQP